jgi:hypothetical protein
VGGGMGMAGMDEFEKRRQCPLRWSFVGPDDGLGGEYVDCCTWGCAGSGCGDVVEAPDGHQVDVVIVFPLVGRY